LAFLRLTSNLEENEIAGFQLYEVDSVGKASLPGVHGPFHWKLDSVYQRGDQLVAEFTNEHSAFYMVTQAQLKRAIASGGFVRAPYKGRFDMLCTAGTNIYTNCGLIKVMSLSAIEDFLLHHLPNRYAGRVGLSLDMFKMQMQTLINVWNGTHPSSTLCEVETKFSHRRWSKIYYKEPDKELLDMVPCGSKTILSVGCGWGAVEEKLKERGANITALPLDSVIGAMAASIGIDMIYKNLQEGLSTLRGREFDCVLVTDMLHLQANPWEMLGKCAQLVASGGALVVQSPNFNYLPVLFRRALGLGEMRKLKSFSEGGVSAFGISAMAQQLKTLGFQVSGQRWFNRPHFNNATPPNHFGIRKLLGRLMAEDWIIQARKCGRGSQPECRHAIVDRVPLEV
jgi:2-polyprenyl-3-methyl-5-hydroxy-6-metoxy-1,4-benzoquinol methylase